MGDWKVFQGTGRQAVGLATDLTRIARNRTLLLSRDIYEHMGSPARVHILFNGDATKVGIRAAEGRPLYSLKVGTISSGGGYKVWFGGVLGALGRLPTETATVPHEWDDGVLVIDVSGVPAREAS